MLTGVELQLDAADDGGSANSVRAGHRHCHPGCPVAWGGLGRYIVDGFARQDMGRLIVGAVLVGMLAIAAELGSRRYRGQRPRGDQTGSLMGIWRIALRFAGWAQVERQACFQPREGDTHAETFPRSPLGRSSVWQWLPWPVDRVTAPKRAVSPRETDKGRSFNFNESVIVAEIYAQGLEANGYTWSASSTWATGSGQTGVGGRRDRSRPRVQRILGRFLEVEQSADPDTMWESAWAASRSWE